MLRAALANNCVQEILFLTAIILKALGIVLMCYDM